MIGAEFDNEIKAVLNLETVDTESQEPSNIKPLFKEHKKLIIRSLNCKWGILSLESCISNKIIPHGLREQVVLATHLQTERFLDKWRQQCACAVCMGFQVLAPFFDNIVKMYVCVSFYCWVNYSTLMLFL